MDPPTQLGLSERLFDSFAADLIADPYPHYDRVRSVEPIHWEPVLRLWVLTRYDYILKVLNDETFEVINLSETIAQFGHRMQRDYTPLIRTADAILFFINGDRHKRDRRTLGRVMTHIPLSQLQPVIREFGKSIVEGLSDKNEFDAVLDYAEMFPALVMSRILGLPPTDAPLFLDWARDFARMFDMVPASVYDRLNQKAAAAMDHLSQRITQASVDGNRTGLSLVYQAAPFEGEAKLAAAAALTFTLFMIGTETTSSLIASCINIILQQPELYGRARDNPSLAGRIVAEVTRLESPVQRAVRVVREERVIGGRTIRAGDRVLLLLGAANRDPLAFVRPAVLDLERRDTDDVAFGAGKHACLGMSLAKLEAEIAVEHFLNMPQLERSDPREAWYVGRSIRRLTRLPIRFCARPGA